MDRLSNGHRTPELAGAHILLVEDDRLILMDLEATVEDAGAATVDTCVDVSAALALLARDQQIDAAVLDIRLRDESIAPVAHELEGRHVPFVFYSGQSHLDPICQQWPDNRIIQKPASRHTIVSALVEALESRGGSARDTSKDRGGAVKQSRH